MDHDAPLDPLKVVWVDPDRISRISGRQNPTERRYRDLGRVGGGDWDRENQGRTFFSAEGFEGTTLYRSFVEHFQGGAEWTETDLVGRQDPDGRNGGIEEAIIARLRRYDRLYERIKAGGYESRVGDLPPAWGDTTRVGCLDAVADEITVDVSRDGDLLFVDGRHRLAIAKLLDLDAIPVAFLVRHEEWMATRKACYERGAPELGIHPDLVERRARDR